MDFAGLFACLGVAVVGGLVLLSILGTSRRADEMLAAWATKNKYTIVYTEYSLLRGPFLLRSGDGNVVYRIKVRDSSGKERLGYARCGGFWLGMWLSDDVTVEWDSA